MKLADSLGHKLKMNENFMNQNLADKRPLSPHLQVYRLPFPAILSIAHRISGVGLSAGLLVLVWWLVSIAMGPDAYAQFMACIGSAFGIFCMLAWSIAFYYHLGNGVRHLLWDMGWGLDLKTVYSSGRIVLGFTLLMTFGTWYAVASRLVPDFSLLSLFASLS